jgi:SAM-dependent methyltransferase
MDPKSMIGRYLQRTGRVVQKFGERLLRSSQPVIGYSSREFEAFLLPEAIAINKARLDHLASLGLELSGKSVLEVGAGIGLHTEFFEERGCDVLCTDGKPINVTEMVRRYPSRRLQILDLDQSSDLSYLGEFDIVYCYGTLYHLSKPEEALKALAQVCKEMALVETCVSLGNYAELHLVREPEASNQSISGVGCRPTRLWVIEILRRHYGHAYITKTQPRHPDFPLNWRVVPSQSLYRAVFVGSKQPLRNSNLLETIPDYQNYAEG